jgi:hypothetical protein
MPAPVPSAALIIELGGAARLRLESKAQLGLAARLLQELTASPLC